MQKNTKKSTKITPDFFALYRSNQLHKYFLSGGIAVFTAFSIVSVSHGDLNMQGLMASVSSVTEAPRGAADIIMTRKDGVLSFAFGAKAEKVDKIQFTLLSDPTRLRSLVSMNPLVHVTTERDTGLYFIQIDLQSATLTPGTILADFAVDIDPGTAIAITDTEFMSEGQRYSLTNKTE